jgi:PmbA protein
MTFEKLQAACRAAGINEVEIYHVVQDGFSISTFNGEVDDNLVYHNNELYIRGVYNGHIASVYVERDVDDEIDNVVSRLLASASAIEVDDPYFIYGGSKEYVTLPESEHDFANYTQEERIEFCRTMEKAIRERTEYVQMTQAQVQAEWTRVSIENSSGLSISREGAQAAVVAVGVYAKDGDVKQGFYFDMVENFSDIDFDKLCREAVDRPLASIGAKSVPSRAYPVVFENKQFASLLSCFLSAISGEAVVKKVCLLADKLGEKVFGDNITIVDDPLCEKSYRKVTFDDEGVATFKKTVVEKGVLKTFLHSLKTAKMLGAEPTGNGFKAGSGDIVVSPTNLVVECGEHSLEEVLAPIADGIYITSMMGQHAGVNAVSGAFNLQASGFKITDGKLGEPITLFVVSGNIVDVLSNVVEIANDVECGRGIVCGSAHIASLSISGQA